MTPKPIPKLAEHLYNIWIEKMRETAPGIEHTHFLVLPQAVQDSWERVARECIMESTTLSQLKALL